MHHLLACGSVAQWSLAGFANMGQGVGQELQISPGPIGEHLLPNSSLGLCCVALHKMADSCQKEEIEHSV